MTLLHFKSAKIYLFFAVLLFVAKPFLGFTMLNRIRYLAKENILVKSFTKRKLEYTEDSRFNMDVVQKKLADPVKQVFLLFTFLLSVISTALLSGNNITARFLNEIRLNLPRRGHTYLLNRKLII